MSVPVCSVCLSVVVRHRPAFALGSAYVKMGCSDTSFTCAPYLLDSAPKLGEQVYSPHNSQYCTSLLIHHCVYYVLL